MFGWKCVYDIIVKEWYKSSISQERERNPLSDVAATKRDTLSTAWTEHLGRS